MHPGKAGRPSLVVKGQGQGWDIKFAFGHAGPWYWGVVAAGIRFARTRLGKPGTVASRRGEVWGALNPGGDGRKDKRTATVPEEPRKESALTPRPRATGREGQSCARARSCAYRAFLWLRPRVGVHVFCVRAAMCASVCAHVHVTVPVSPSCMSARASVSVRVHVGWGTGSWGGGWGQDPRDHPA